MAKPSKRQVGVGTVLYARIQEFFRTTLHKKDLFRDAEVVCRDIHPGDVLIVVGFNDVDVKAYSLADGCFYLFSLSWVRTSRFFAKMFYVIGAGKR